MQTEAKQKRNAAQRRQMLVSDALHTDSITCTGSSSDVLISPTNVSPTNTHEHNSMYHTMRLDVMMRDDAATLCGAVDGYLQQVKDQRGYSTWHK